MLAVRLTPRGGRDGADGWALDADGRPYLKARVASAPVEGEANAALILLLSKSLGVPRSAVSLARGGQSRLKRIEVAGLDDQALRSRLTGM